MSNDQEYAESFVAEPVSDLNATEVKTLSFAYAKKQGVLLTEVNNDQAKCVCREDVQPVALAEVRRFVGMPLKMEFLNSEKFDAVLQASYEGSAAQNMNMMDDFGDEDDLSAVAKELHEPKDLLESNDDAPIIRLINALLTEAIKINASDIHIEPYENKLFVRFRVDGVLQEILTQKKMLAPLVVSRIKVMAKLDIAEKRLPQDGRISLRIAGRAVDVRVSTLPSGHGERVVMRLLDKQAGRLNLEHLGMESKSLSLMSQIINKPHGVILVTGPTGSGKTTTLYAALTQLNNKSRNILTVEDPIEYFLEGVGQTNVNTRVDMTFARGLRAILRQDPDIVMIGEIRDVETADISVQASLTGHLVLSTLHTNTAIGAVTRLRDMGVEPFLLSSSLIGVVAQRLIRLLCNECKEPFQMNSADCDAFKLSSKNPPTVYKPVGCKTCNHTGYAGRTGIYEIVAVDETFRGLIHDGASEHAMESYARTITPGIRQDGLRRILAGVTSLEEVFRVTRED